MGRLFQLQNLGIIGNPLPADILNVYHEPNGLKKLLEFMLDHLNGKNFFEYFSIFDRELFKIETKILTLRNSKLVWVQDLDKVKLTKKLTGEIDLKIDRETIREVTESGSRNWPIN